MLGAFSREVLIATGTDDADFSAYTELGYTLHAINPATHCKLCEGFSTLQLAKDWVMEYKQEYGMYKDGLD